MVISLSKYSILPYCILCFIFISMTWHGLISVGFVLIGPNFIANCHSFQWGDETNKMIVFLKSPSFFWQKVWFLRLKIMWLKSKSQRYNNSWLWRITYLGIDLCIKHFVSWIWIISFPSTFSIARKIHIRRIYIYDMLYFKKNLDKD